MYRKKVWKWKINILAISWAKFSVLDDNIKKKLKMQTKENLFFIIKFEAIISFKRWERTLQQASQRQVHSKLKTTKDLVYQTTKSHN